MKGPSLLGTQDFIVLNAKVDLTFPLSSLDLVYKIKAVIHNCSFHEAGSLRRTE